MAHDDGCDLPIDNGEADETEGMPSCPAPNDWRAELVWAHHRIFQPPESHPELAEGLPDCGVGWLGILDSTCVRIQEAIEPDDGDTIKLVQIKEKHGTLRILWEGTVSAHAQTEIERSIELACARSACTCEICGEEGRLYRRGDWLATACALHAKGEPVPVKPGLENVYILRGLTDDSVGILSCRSYDRETDSFVDIDPDSIGVDWGETTTYSGGGSAKREDDKAALTKNSVLR